jgi:hypothetical protein
MFMQVYFRDSALFNPLSKYSSGDNLFSPEVMQ